MSNWRVSRRHFMTSAGVVFTLPMLEALLPRQSAWAQSGGARRFIGMYMPNGTYNKTGDAVWYPPTGPLTANLPLVLAPFAANIKDFSILKGIRTSARDQASSKLYQARGRGGAHVTAVTTYLSGQAFTNPLASVCTVPGSSFDQIVAQKTGKAAMVLNGGADGGSPDGLPFRYGNYISYNNGKQVEPNANPVDLYNRMFRNLISTANVTSTNQLALQALTDHTTAARRNPSILDHAVDDIKALKAKLGKNDNLKLDDYLTTIRSLERTIASSQPTPTPLPTAQPTPAPSPSATPRATATPRPTATPGGTPTNTPQPSATPRPTPTPLPTAQPTPTQSPGPISRCAPGTPPPNTMNNVDFNGSKDDYVERVKAFMDMMVLAFTCDLTRSISFMFDGDCAERRFNSQVPKNLVYNNASLTAGNHTGVSHYSTNANGRDKCITRDRLYMHLNVYLLDKLRGVTDATGSPILDNTIVLNGFAVSDGAHAGGSAGLPIVVGGGRNFINPGNCYDVSSFDLKDLLYTFGTHLGIGIDNFAGNNKIVKL